MLPITLHIMPPMHLQSLKLLPPTVKEDVHLQENSLHMTLTPNKILNIKRVEMKNPVINRVYGHHLDLHCFQKEGIEI